MFHFLKKPEGLSNELIQCPKQNMPGAALKDVDLKRPVIACRGDGCTAKPWTQNLWARLRQFHWAFASVQKDLVRDVFAVKLHLSLQVVTT